MKIDYKEYKLITKKKKLIIKNESFITGNKNKPEIKS